MSCSPKSLYPCHAAASLYAMHDTIQGMRYYGCVPRPIISFHAMQWCIRGINAAKTAYLSVSFTADFFDVFHLAGTDCSCSALVKVKSMQVKAGQNGSSDAQEKNYIHRGTVTIIHD